MQDKRLIAFERLLTIMDELREKCPWDKKQTFETLRKLTIEETYELSDAIHNQDLEEIKKELGDLFLHLVFYSKLGNEVNAFDVTDVLNTVCDKLIERHPHIYGNVQVDDEEAVKRNWEKIKLEQGNKSVLGGVPTSLPSMNKAQRIQEKVRGVGFDWENKEQVWGKVEEEINELKEVEGKNEVETEKELGDVFFSLINYARFLNIDPEAALEKTNRKFIARFQKLEVLIKEDNKDITTMKLEEMDTYWEKAKHILGK
jgi:XTP/dITP diphosphohydrolase